LCLLSDSDVLQLLQPRRSFSVFFRRYIQLSFLHLRPILLVYYQLIYHYLVPRCAIESCVYNFCTSDKPWQVIAAISFQYVYQLSNHCLRGIYCISFTILLFAKKTTVSLETVDSDFSHPPAPCFITVATVLFYRLVIFM